MSKKINIEVKNSDELEFTLLENGNKGDYICLNDVNKIDFSSWKNKILKKKDEYLKPFFQSREKEIIDNAINKFKASDEYIKMYEENSRLNEELKSSSKIAVNDFKESIEYKELIEKRDKYLLQEEKYKNDIREYKDNFKNTVEYIELKKDIAERLEESYKKLFDVKKEEINNLKSENDKIQRSMNQLNIKKLGEGLEIYLRNEYDNSFIDGDNTRFFKETKNIKNTKPDFIFEILDKSENVVIKTVIEAKTEEQTSTNKKKNSDHYEKLWRDTINRKGDYALLVSELEKDNNFVVKKVQEKNYHNMFVIRPQYFITFLKLLNNFAKEKINISNNKTIDFKEKERVLKDFESFKKDSLIQFADDINKNFINIKKNSDAIKKANIEISKISDKYLNENIEKIKNKINKFSINKLASKI